MSRVQDPSTFRPASTKVITGPIQSGFRVQVAEGLHDVLASWRLLYRAYRRAGYVAANTQELHTVPQALTENTCVLLGRMDDRMVSTITAIGDNPQGLPLDTVYPKELEAMRRHGQHLVEIGLLGEDPGDEASNPTGFTGMFELMRWTFYFGKYIGATDFLCGIPPSRARLYKRLFGFEAVGQVKDYSTVENNPVMLLRFNLAACSKHHAPIA